MPRAFLFVLDSVGIGGAPDAADYVNVEDGRAVPDLGANTLGHVAAAGPLAVPHLERLGLGLAAEAATGKRPAGLGFEGPAEGAYANLSETSRGKDTPSGHWEIAGVPVPFEWHTFPRTTPCFPAWLTDAMVRGGAVVREGVGVREGVREGALPGLLGDRHASGTAIIEELGAESIETGRPIAYTSADSVVQIAAHEGAFGLERLLALCETTRALLDASDLNVGRVIARPFVGPPYTRTGNRRDYAVPPPEPTLLDRAAAAGREVIAVGKIADIYAHCGPTRVVKADGNDALVDATLRAMDEAPDGALVMTNFVDFDQLHGHRRDVPGYARALEHFDRRLPEMTRKLRDGDLMVLTADHGCDPSWVGTDHTREQVFALMAGAPRGSVEPGYRGARSTFADIGATVAQHLGLDPGPHGEAM